MLGSAVRPAPPGVEFVLCDTPKRIEWLFKNLDDARGYSWDIESTHATHKGDDETPVLSDLDEKIIGTSFCWSPRVAAYLPLYMNREGETRHFRRDAFDQVARSLKLELQKEGKDRDGWNTIFDKAWMKRCFDIDVPEQGADWMLAHHLLDENRAESSHRLKDCAATYIDPKAVIYEQDLARALDQYDSKLRRYSMVPLEVIWPYGCSDSWFPTMLGPIFEQRLNAEGLDQLFWATVMPLQHVVTQIHLTGLPVAMDKIEPVRRDMIEEILKLNGDICVAANRQFDPSSPEQVSITLFDHLRLPPRGERGKSGFFSTDKETLAALEDEHPIVPMIQRHRRVARLFSMYVEGINRQAVGVRYYPNFKIHGTVSGRMSEGLVMSMPRGEKGGDIVKGLFQAPDGYSFLFRDLSQIELRIAAHLSQDPIMVEGYRSGLDFDLHCATAIQMFNLDVPAGVLRVVVDYVKTHYKAYRSIAKNLNFGALFGASAKRLAQLINAEFPEMKCTVQKAQEFIDQYYKTMKGLRALIDRTYEESRTIGFVTNMFGRRRRLPDAGLRILADRSDERPRYGGLRKCFARDSPSFWYDLDVTGMEDAELDRMTSEQARQMVHSLGNQKFLHAPDWRVSCDQCKLLVPCMWQKARWQRRSRVEDAYRKAFSFLIQSSAVDYANLALVQVCREIARMGLQSKPVIQIHDSIGFLVPDAELETMIAITKDKMEHAYPMSIPIGSDLTVCRNWGEENLKVPKKCGRCKTDISDVRHGRVIPVGQSSSYRQTSASCQCGWDWQHDNVFQTDLS